MIDGHNEICEGIAEHKVRYHEVGQLCNRYQI